MSTLYRLKFLDVSITWWVVLAFYGLAAGCSGDGPTELPDASRDRIVFASQAAGSMDIYSMDQNGGNLVQLTASTSGLSSEIWVSQADGTQGINLTNTPGFEGYPRWLPVP